MPQPPPSGRLWSVHFPNHSINWHLNSSTIHLPYNTLPSLYQVILYIIFLIKCIAARSKTVKINWKFKSNSFLAAKSFKISIRWEEHYFVLIKHTRKAIFVHFLLFLIQYELYKIVEKMLEQFEKYPP